MEPELRQDITNELRKELNREPSEKEIMNGQTDTNLMGKILIKRQKKSEVEIGKQKLEIDKIKKPK